MKALKTYWGNLSGKTATAKGVAQKTKKDAIPGREHEDAVQTGLNRKAQESRLANRKQQEADWPRNQDGSPRGGKRKVGKGKKARRLDHAGIVKKISKLEQQIKDGTLTSKSAINARAELGRAKDELGAATKDLAAAKKSRKVTRIATGAVGATAAAGATYANRDKIFSEIISNRLVNIELALDEKLSEIELSLSREINKNLPALLRGTPPSGQKIRLYGEGLQSLVGNTFKPKKKLLGSPLGPPAQRKPRKTTRRGSENPPVRKSKRDKDINYHDGSDRRIDRLGTRGHRKGHVKKKHDRETIRKEHLEAKLDEAIEFASPIRQAQ